MTQSIAYLGPSGAGLGFQLAGLQVMECADSQALLLKLAQLVRQPQHAIILIDESLASSVLGEIERFNQHPTPALIMVPSPTNPQNVAARRMQQLMIKAIGSDILSNTDKSSKL